MRINFRFLSGPRSRVAVVIVVAFVVIIAARVSAHRVIGQNYPTMATALIQSPTASPTDLPIPIYSTGLSVICVRVTNTSVVDARIAAIGLELPGTRAGFALLTPLDLGMRIYENVGSVPGFPGVTLDLVLAAAVPGSTLGGIPRNTTPTQICLSGPFDAAVPIETMLNGVFVLFDGGEALRGVSDIGVWERRPRP
jgi:hypothetical protein